MTDLFIAFINFLINFSEIPVFRNLCFKEQILPTYLPFSKKIINKYFFYCSEYAFNLIVPNKRVFLCRVKISENVHLCIIHHLRFCL